MKSLKTIQEVRAFTQSMRSKNAQIGFVPTMGALHNGHIELVKNSLRECDSTIVSIFVNPTQFNNQEDLDKYPKLIERDIELLDNAGCDAVFIPEVKEVYQQDSSLKIELGSITKDLEGRFRPGHFNGVALVVSKLFNIVQPDTAFFGQKDIQQFYVIKKLRDELNFPIELQMVSTIREESGLAMSSRNERLNAQDRLEASLIFKALSQAKNKLVENQEVVSVKDSVVELFKQSDRLSLEYFEVVDTHDFKPLEKVDSKDNVALCIAAEIGGVRLIDNLPLFS